MLAISLIQIMLEPIHETSTVLHVLSNEDIILLLSTADDQVWRLYSKGFFWRVLWKTANSKPTDRQSGV